MGKITAEDFEKSVQYINAIGPGMDQYLADEGIVFDDDFIRKIEVNAINALKVGVETHGFNLNLVVSVIAAATFIGFRSGLYLGRMENFEANIDTSSLN